MKALISFLYLFVVLPPAAFAAEPPAGPALPFPETPSASKAAPSLKASTHQWRKPAQHVTKDAPNVVVILLDDVGFGQAGTYGGPIHTPTLDRIANTGISYNQFHTTALCSPTRAALLTGRNHHNVGNGVITEMAADWDGYIGTIPQTMATAARVLTEYGYSTAAFGKWHNTPATETTSMGPFTHWPTGSGIGFSYFYGFLAGETSQWEPRLVENLNQVEPPHDESYHLSTDLADKAVSWMRQHRAYTPDKPFFIYYAPGAGHGPHHVAKEWADKGGTRNPMAVSWPAKIKVDKTPRPQFTHVIDLVPTIYEVTGVTPPASVDGFKQDTLDGTSFAYTFNDPKAEPRKDTQYFEIFGNRAIYHDGWMVSALGPSLVPEHARQGENWDPAGDTWEHYDLRKDFSEADNIAAANPQKVTELTALFMKEAKANKVFPIGGSFWYALHPEDRVSTPYKRWEFDASNRRMPEFTAPGLGRLNNTVAIDAEVPENASGVLYALGGFSGGLALFMDEGHLAFEYNLMMIERYSTRSEKKLSADKHTIQVDTTIDKPGSPGKVVIQVDGTEYARLELKQTVALAFTASETFDVGTDLGSPVSKFYYDRRPFAFSGKIKKIAITLK